MAENTAETNHLELATELTIAWLSNPNTRASAEEVPSFLETMHGAVIGLSSSAKKAGSEDEGAQPEFTPAVSVRKSLSSKDHIISMIDGKQYKTLRRHLARHGLTPDQYRERYGLKSDYPMVAENYAEVRRNLAKKIGLGRKPRGADANDRASAEGQAQAKPRMEGEAAAKSAPDADKSANGNRDAKTAAKPRRKAREPNEGADRASAPAAAGKDAQPKAGAAKSVAKEAKPAAKSARAPKPAAAKNTAPKANDAAATPESDAKA